MASHNMKFMFASFIMDISISQSKRGTRTTLNSDSTGAVTSKSRFLKYLYYEYILPYATSSERGFSPATTATSGLSKIFSVAFHDIKFVFASFLMVKSISQSKRVGRTTFTVVVNLLGPPLGLLREKVGPPPFKNPLANEAELESG